jgi:hypothetical protein
MWHPQIGRPIGSLDPLNSEAARFKVKNERSRVEKGGLVSLDESARFAFSGSGRGGGVSGEASGARRREKRPTFQETLKSGLACSGPRYSKGKRRGRTGLTSR